MEVSQRMGHSERTQLFLTNPDVFQCNRDVLASGSADECTPPLMHCQFCGGEIVTWAFGWQGILFWSPEPERCMCEQSKLKWREIDNAAEHDKDMLLRKAKAEAQRHEIDRLMSKSGLVDRYPGLRFDTWVADTEQRDKAIKNARWYVEKFPEMKAKGSGIYIAGDSERGKTHLAAGIAYELVQRRVPVIMTSMGDLLGRLRASFNDGSDAEQRLIMVMNSVDLLVIDDLGKEKPTEWALEKMFSIIDTRVNRKLPIIITTNYTDDELYRRLAGDDGYSRNQNDPKMVKAIIARLHRACIDMKAGWQRWSAKSA